MTDRDLSDQFGLWSEWIRNCALPLWADAGFDRINSRFEERLDLEGRRIENTPIRLLVQSRQVYVYAEAALMGIYPPGRELAIAAYRSMVACYFEIDGHPGWIFSIYRDGTIASPVRDTYAHAFVLFAIAHYYRLTGEQGALDLADKTWDYLDTHLALPGGGFSDAAPRPDLLRRQNPHMHLLEAALWLFEATGDRKYLARATKIATIFHGAFFDRETGSVIEYLDDDLRPAAGDKGRIREPGHHYEWAWLLDWLARAGGPSDAHVINRIMDHAEAFGWSGESHLVFDEVYDDGQVCAKSFRVWPLTEAMKAYAVRSDDASKRDLKLARAIEMLRTRFLELATAGGWIDRLDAVGRQAVEFIPASSFYHIFGAYSQVSRIIHVKSWPETIDIN